MARTLLQRWHARQDLLFAFALAFFVGVVVWFGRAIEDFLTPTAKAISAPAFVGLSYADALSAADSAQVKINVLQRAPSDRFPKDVVMRQDPVPGAQVREGRQISLVVSTGVQIFAMPDLRDESLREVGLDLSRYKLVLGKVKTVASDLPLANRVVGQDPSPLTSVRVGSIVNLELSKGAPLSLKVPNFENMAIDEARAYAADNHVTLGQIVWTPFGRYGAPRGVVVRQRPEAGTQIDPSQDVSLQVSAGPRESGYLVRQVHAVATVPADAALDPTDASVERAPSVRVQVRDETGTWNVYDAYAQPKQRLAFNLTVVGTAELDVFVNNELIDSTKLGVEPKMQEQQQLGPPPPSAARADAAELPKGGER